MTPAQQSALTSLAAASQTLTATAAAVAEAEYDAASHRLIHGPGGFGFYGLPLPQGSAAMRHFLEQHALR